MNVAPKSVSGRVVNTSIRSAGRAPSVPEASAAPDAPAAPESGKCSRAPSERPIQLRWAVFVVSDQSIQSRLSSSRCA